MSAQQTEGVTQATPSLCSNGCGFYSNPGSGGMCSKCSKQQQAKQQQQIQPTASVCPAPAPAPEPTSVAPLPTSARAAAAEAPSTSSPTQAPAAPPSKPEPSRCAVCRKKVGLATAFKCKCSNDLVFCGQHRYAEAHTCNFDYKGTQRAQLAENNPLVQAAKLQKI